MYTFIDTHTHIYEKEFQEDLAEVITRAQAAGATQILLPNVDAASITPIASTCQQFPNVCRPMMGLHPEEVKGEEGEVLAQMYALLSADSDKYCAVGEVGLDYYWDATHAEAQKQVFQQQIEWSIEFHKPLSIHLRSAHEDGIACLQNYREALVGGVFHCFGGTAEEAQEALSFSNFYLGIGGLVTFKKSTLPEVLSLAVPLDRLVVETDAPYLTPVPYRGKRNEPAYIPFIIEKLAEIYHTTPEYVAEITTANAIRVFGELKK